MFGFVTIDKSELKIKDYETYRAVYCSLCKALGKKYSVLARFILNYDCTFLSLFIMSRTSSCPAFKAGRCRFNPLKKCSYATNAEDALNKGAALTIISSYYKLLDSIADGGFFKKLGCCLVRPLFASWHNKAKASFPDYESAVKDMYLSQLKCEQNADACLDMAAEPTARMLSAVLSTEAKDSTERQILEEMGYHLGRWIYLMDAADDLKDDSKSGNFNPFILKYGSLEDVDINEVNALISHSYYLFTKAYELADKLKLADILDNIVYSGLAKRQSNVLFPKGK